MSNITLDDLVIVVLESPYETIKTEEGKVLFSNLIDIKLKGYLSYHESGVLPVDTTDFLATHLIIANKKNPFQDIYMTYKSTSYKTCERYNVPFPFTTILNNYASKECSLKMQSILENCRAKNEDLSYDTGWTNNPKIKGNAELQMIFKDLVSMFVVNHHSDPRYNVPHWVTLGILKVKTDQLFLKMGCREISDQAVFQHPFLNLTECRAVISVDQAYNDIVFANAKKYQSLWDNRITITADGPIRERILRSA